MAYQPSGQVEAADEAAYQAVGHYPGQPLRRRPAAAEGMSMTPTPCKHER